jgi:flagellar assembly protein FliH
MSDPAQTVERWQAPFFEQPTASPKPLDTSEVEKLAQSRGFQAGKWEGLESGRAEAEEIVSRMTGLLNEMAKPFASLDNLVTQELANLAMLIAKQVIRRELMTRSEVVLELAKEAFATLSSLEGEIEISLHPSDVEMVHQLAQGSLKGKSWRLIPDPNFLPGGCRVKTPVSYVDASIEKQMELAFANLMDLCEDELDD